MSFRDLVRGGNAGRAAVVGGGMIIHAVGTFIVTTVLPSVVREIGGLDYFAWSTTLYVVASLVAGTTAARLLARVGPRVCYRLALGCFAAGCALCALSASMGMLLAGRFVQGFGAGLLSALSFTMIRLLFPERMWPRAMAVVSAAWGIATLLGPAIGGAFAQYGAWRAAFWSLLACAPLLLGLVEASLPRDMPRTTAPQTPLAGRNLALLAGSVLAVSAGSTAGEQQFQIGGLLIAGVGLFLFVARERGEGARLLPRGATDPTNPLGGTYAAMILLLIGVTTEIFVPYFLQALHGASPLHAGYISALMAGGWTLGSIASSGAPPRAVERLLPGGPLLLAAGLSVLAITMPAPDDGARLVPIAAGLLAMGLGIGLCWPHLGTRVFRFAPEGEREVASASITVVVMVGNAFGSALGGMTTNMAGLTTLGRVAGAASASGWLFGLFVLAPLSAAIVVRRLVTAARAPAAAE